MTAGATLPKELPLAPPFVLRARILSPLESGETRYIEDGRLAVDAAGRIAAVGSWVEPEGGPEAHVDARPWLALPGLVDLHTHVPQVPNSGVGAGLDLLTWLERYTLPLERGFDARTAAACAPAAFEAMASAGTTTVVAYATTDPAATEAVFRAAEAHGIRAIVGLVLMDRPVGGSVDAGPRRAGEALAASERLCARWNGRDRGRLGFAFTPRFAVSCTAELLSESARLAAAAGAHWQTHLSEDRRELAAVRESFPEAADYLDVYERAGALGPNALFAHAIHLSDREVARLAESGAAVAHCPASNLFLASGIMPLARYLEAGLRIGLGSDVSGGPGPSLFEVMRIGAYSHNALESWRAAPSRGAGTSRGGDPEPIRPEPGGPGRTGREPDPGAIRRGPDPLAWLRLGTLDGARALGQADRFGSLEPGKEADLILVDAALTEPVAGAGRDDGPADIVSRLIFRTHPAMVRGAWVRGRRLPARAPGGAVGCDEPAGRWEA